MNKIKLTEFFINLIENNKKQREWVINYITNNSTISRELTELQTNKELINGYMVLMGLEGK